MMVEARERKKFSWKKAILILLIVIIVIGGGGIITLNMFLNKSLPTTEGTAEIPVDEDVEVTTDEDGVPHIKAQSLKDMYTAQGYIQAQSRMVQMDLSRRQASGTLSEIVGKDAVDTDKYFRTLGLRRAAEDSYDMYSDEAKDVLDWFADGINAYMEEAKEDGTLPVEYTLLGTEPEPWSPVDSLTIGKYMAFDLGGHWEQQAFNYYAVDQFSKEKAEELMPSYPENAREVIEKTELDIAASFENAVVPPAFNGSNNWVVSGEKTASGKPLLADDPHLGLATPSIWYEMHLEAEDMNVGGVIFAGVPGIILGHNEHISWGVTNTGPDVQQLYIEKQNPDNEQEFLFEDEWEEAETISEPIHVKDEDTIDYEVTETRHGPIVSEFAEASGKEDMLALRWTALDPTAELQAIMEINQATDWDEFEKGLEDFHAPAQNFVFAGDDGTIAYKANGKIPIYEDGKDALLPLPGWEAETEWQDFIPFDELPRVVNPDKGFIATANNKIAGDDYPYHISNVWAQPYRYERIYEVLESNDELTLQDMEDLQMDPTNLRAREFVPLWTEALESEDLSAAEKHALETLNSWDFSDKADEAAPLIFDAVFDELSGNIYEEIDENMLDLFKAKDQTTDELLRKGDNAAWIKEHGGLTKVLQKALSSAVKELEDEYGAKQEKWQWGDYHQVQFRHPLSDANKLLDFVFNRTEPLPVDGSSVTPMAASHDGTGLVDHGASWRFVVDMNEPTNGHHIVGPGQSGHFRSPWYADQTEDWVHGDYHETNLEVYEGEELLLTPK